MKRIPAWLTYLVARLVFLIVPFLILWLVLGIPAWLSIIFAVIIAFALSVLLLNRVRAEAISTFESRRKTKNRVSDESHEDAL